MLGDLIEAFDLQRLDHRGVLTKRNSRRYLAGQRVSPEAEAEVRGAVADAIVEAGLQPPGLSPADLKIEPSDERRRERLAERLESLRDPAGKKKSAAWEEYDADEDELTAEELKRQIN